MVQLFFLLEKNKQEIQCLEQTLGPIEVRFALRAGAQSYVIGVCLKFAAVCLSLADKLARK